MYSDPMGLQAQAAGCALGLPFGGPLGCAAGAAVTTIATGVALTALISTPGDSQNADQCPPAPGGKDPCKGLRDQLQDHERKLRQYMADPMSMDNKGFLAGALAKGDNNLYNTIYTSRILSPQGQIANFRKQLEECERKNGKP